MVNERRAAAYERAKAGLSDETLPPLANRLCRLYVGVVEMEDEVERLRAENAQLRAALLLRDKA